MEDSIFEMWRDGSFFERLLTAFPPPPPPLPRRENVCHNCFCPSCHANRDRPLFPLGLMISRRQGFFPPSIEHLQIFSSTDCADNFLKNVQSSHNYCSIWKQLFSDAPLGQAIYFIDFSHTDNFFPIMISPREK